MLGVVIHGIHRGDGARVVAGALPGVGIHVVEGEIAAGDVDADPVPLLERVKHGSFWVVSVSETAKATSDFGSSVESLPQFWRLAASKGEAAGRFGAAPPAQNRHYQPCSSSLYCFRSALSMHRKRHRIAVRYQTRALAIREIAKRLFE